ncbi:Ribose import permease protein RbsC [subsurface metagenome]
MDESGTKTIRVHIRNIVLSYGFVIVFVLLFIGLSIGTQHFLSVSNIMNFLHAAVPLLVVTPGLALVIMTRKLDISIGSIVYLTAGIGAVLIYRKGVPFIPALLIMMISGLLCGAINGSIVVFLRVNPFITTLGTMFVFRGIALQVTNQRVITLPQALRKLGHISVGPLFIDILIVLVILFFIHFIKMKTKFGRYIVAIGSNAEVAQRMGVRVEKISFITFVLSGFFASMGGTFSMLQLGSVTQYMGFGMEFKAIAAIVIGGISLFGGRGTMIPGLLLGVYTLAIIENGLNHIGASPYVYPFVRGGLIFIAMYADSLKLKYQMRLE